MDAVSAPVHTRAEEGRLTVTDVPIVSVLIENRRSRPVRVIQLEADADDGLMVTYLGHSTCARGCPGGGYLDDPKVADLVGQVDGTYPIELPPKAKTRFLEFRLDVKSGSPAQRLLDKCGLFVSSVTMTLDDGSKAEVRHAASNYVLAVHPAPSQVGHC